jgi:hypothetical protein
MIGAFLTIFVACWVYQGAVSVNRSNVMRWVVIGAVMVFALQAVFMALEIYLFVDEDDVDLTSELGGRIQAIYRELMPSIAALVVAAVYRTKFVMQQELSVGNLFSGMNIFKSSGETSSEATDSKGSNEISSEATDPKSSDETSSEGTDSKN